MRLDAHAQHELDCDSGDALDRCAERAARYSQIPAAIASDPDDAQALPPECLDDPVDDDDEPPRDYAPAGIRGASQHRRWLD